MTSSRARVISSPMAWEFTLLECSFRGVVIPVRAIRDVISRAVYVSEVPYVEGGVTKDQGGRPTVFPIRAIWFGRDYEERVRNVLRAISEPGVGEFIHPVWGSIPRAQFLRAEIDHDAAAPNSCAIRMEFMESEPEAPFFEVSPTAQVQDTVGLHGDSAIDQAINMIERAIQAMQIANPLASLDELRRSMLGPILAMSSAVRSFVSSGLDVMNYPRAWARDIASFSNTVLSIASFPDRLVSEWNAVTNVFKNIRLQWGGDLPVSGYSTWQAGSAPTVVQAQAATQSYVSVAMATAQADAAAIVLASEADNKTLTPVEIETITNSVRDEISVAINVIRATVPFEENRPIVESLKNQALAVQQAARAIIEAKPPLVRRQLSAPGNLRLIAHQFYGDHTRASELLRLNALRNPNELKMGDVLNAYSR